VVQGLAGLSNEGLSGLLKKFQDKRLLVVGDLLVSRFLEVSARKLAREAPVPAGDYVGEALLPGGAANLANEVASLGGSVSVIGMVGEDNYGVWLKEDLARNGVGTEGIVVDKSRPTSLRTWIMVNRLHYLRIDQEVRKEVQVPITKAFAAARKRASLASVLIPPRVDGPVVGYVVPGVGHGRRVPRVEPDRVHAQVAQVGQTRADAGQVAHAVAVTVGEAAYVDLVDRGIAPPLRRHVLGHFGYLLPGSTRALSARRSALSPL